jgi:serine/threonine protein kinase
MTKSYPQSYVKLFTRHYTRETIAHLRVGDAVRLGRTPYIISQILRGGMGIVLLIDRRENSRPDGFSFGVHRLRMAVKAVRPEFLNEDVSTLFRRELTIWAGFDHPHIVRLSEILNAGVDGWVAAMHRCQGSLVDTLKAHHNLTTMEATFILLDIVEALSYAFTKSKVLHLDLKPGNILFDRDLTRKDKYAEDSLLRNSYRVSDWGLASVKAPQLTGVAGLPPSHPEAMRTFNNVGTVLYMAPERFVSGFESSIASDVFSLGLIYFQLLFGHLPYDRDLDPVVQLTTCAYYGTVKQVLAGSRCTLHAKAVLLRMLHPQAELRYREYDDLRRDLKRISRSAAAGIRWLLGGRRQS